MGEARLIGTEQVTCAPQLQVLEGDRIPATQFGIVLENLEASLCFLREICRDDEVAIRSPIAAPNTAADLVQLRQAETFRVIDDERVGVGDVEAVLDDCRTNEQIHAPLHEIRHHVVQLVGGHLAVSHLHTCLRGDLSHSVGRHLDRRDPVVEKKDLAAAVDLSGDGLREDLLTPRHDVGQDRHPVTGGCSDQGQVAEPAE